MRSQPYKIELLKAGIMALAGLLAILQPWIGLFRVLGWVVLIAAGSLFISLLLKVSSAKKVLRDPIAEFSCGAIVCRRGVLFEGQLYNFSTFGTDLTGLDLLDDRLVFAFSFISRGKTRGRDILAVPFESCELEKAKAVAEAFDLPPIDHSGDPEPARDEQPEPAALPDPPIDRQNNIATKE